MFFYSSPTTGMTGTEKFKMITSIHAVFFWLIVSGCHHKNNSGAQAIGDTTFYGEKHRPQFHFSPKEKWTNDPNGMVYYKGEYHLFYQHYPEALVWGPMHWGHAVSNDLAHWTHLPIALYPDSLGYIFSGSVVVDENNTSGFGTLENPPLVAIFTYHSDEINKAGRSDFQYQAIAYSTDKGRNWTKYEKNPVLKNQGISDFRDPKVFWHSQSQKWVMILAVKDYVELWSSKDLISWSKLSNFGHEYGAHSGVWECPDLFQTDIEGEEEKKWVMIVSIMPGGPNGGSGTQYFIGDFDGKTFIADGPEERILWLDYGPDDYAGVTWSNAPDARRIFLGWMSNWAYADKVPTAPWRGAMTTARDLILTKLDDELYLKSAVVKELSAGMTKTISLDNILVADSINLNKDGISDASQSVVTGTFEAKDFSIELSNSVGQKIIVGFDSKKNRFFCDRSKSGKLDFSNKYIHESFAPRISHAETISLTFVADVSSVEVFFDDGLTVMTSLFFPDKPLSDLKIKSPQPLKIEKLEIKQLKSIWN